VKSAYRHIAVGIGAAFLAVGIVASYTATNLAAEQTQELPGLELTLKPGGSTVDPGPRLTCDVRPAVSAARDSDS
jgi:hypothetical protein